jgi:hypothetical protein
VRDRVKGIGDCAASSVELEQRRRDEEGQRRRDEEGQRRRGEEELSGSGIGEGLQRGE